MNLAQLQYFSVLAKTEHYTRAAEMLSITQPSLTHSIKELEKELNVCLFDKKGRNIKLNKYGKIFLQYVDRSLNELAEGKKMIESLIDPTQGTINLAYIYSLGQQFVPKIIKSFYKKYNNNNIKFNLIQKTTMEILEYFNLDVIDLAFTSKIEKEDLECIPISRQELCIITPRGHELATKEEVELREAAKYPFILYSSNSGLRKVIDDLFKNAGITPHVIFELEEDSAVCGMVSANLGIAIVPRLFWLEKYDVAILKLKNCVYERNIYLSFPKKKYMSPSVVKFKEFVTDGYWMDHNPLS